MGVNADKNESREGRPGIMVRRLRHRTSQAMVQQWHLETKQQHPQTTTTSTTLANLGVVHVGGVLPRDVPPHDVRHEPEHDHQHGGDRKRREDQQQHPHQRDNKGHEQPMPRVLSHRHVGGNYYLSGNFAVESSPPSAGVLLSLLFCAYPPPARRGRRGVVPVCVPPFSPGLRNQHYCWWRDKGCLSPWLSMRGRSAVAKENQEETKMSQAITLAFLSGCQQSSAQAGERGEAKSCTLLLAR